MKTSMLTEHGGRSEAGFTLAELMVVTMLTIVIVGGSVKAFMDMRRVSETARSMVDMNLNLRTALNVVTRDLMQAGRNLEPGGIAFPSGGGVTVKRPAPSTAATFPSTWGVLVGIAPGASIGPTVNGTATDVLTMLYDDQTFWPVTQAGVGPQALSYYNLAQLVSDGSSATVDTRMPLTGVIASSRIQTGDLILFTNVNGMAIQQVTSVSGQTLNVANASTDLFGFNNRTAPSGSIMALRTAGSQNFPATTAARIWMITYYIDATTSPSNPRLVRRINMGTPRPIALGIENLQVSYDLVDGATNPTNQETPVSPNSNQQIRNVNLYLGARQIMLMSGEAPVRNGAATQIGLRSMSFANRYQ